MKRTVGIALALLTVAASGGIAAAAIIPPGTGGPGLAAVGPVSATDGYPVWYKDKNGLRLESCVAAADPLCPARGPLPDETAPVSFPANYPDEAFYSLANANMTTSNGGKALAVVALEQAFRNGPVIPGDQITFARVRIKITNAKDGADYKVVTPAGSKTVRTNGKVAGLVFDTEDIGVDGPGDFTGALGGRVGPFLTWDTFPSDPSLKPDLGGKDTYVGDGTTQHKIKGSPYGTNIFRIEGPGINPSTTADACPTVPGPIPDCVETDLFTVQGKLATTSGVTAEQATYSRSSGDVGLVDVYATSETGPQAIEVKDVSVGGAEFSPTGLAGGDGHYFARLGYSGPQPPRKVQITNTGDVPATAKTIDVVDRLHGNATYDTDSRILTVTAVSSDTAETRTLSVNGYGPLAQGTFTSDLLEAPPVSVRVASDAGGSVVLPVQITGGKREPIPVTAQAGPDQNVYTGQTVTLDGSASSGPVSTFAWTNPDGISLSDPNSATPTFTAPAPGTYAFTLTVNGPGGPSTATVTITTTSAVTATAEAGADQTGIQRGSKVTLDGSKSIGAATFTWTQVIHPGDPAVTLTDASTARPGFVFPFYKYPATTGALTFNLHISSPDGTTSDAQTSVSPSADAVTITAARYTASKKEWRVDGTSSLLAGQTITVHLGALSGPVIGTAIVDATGSFSWRGTSTTVGATGQTVSVESQLGGTGAGFPVKVQ